MKKFILACIAAASIAGAANAATYTPFVTATPFRVAGAPGMQTRATVIANRGAQNFNGMTYSFDLATVGQTVSMDIYGLVAFDAPIDADDLLPSPSTATFDFGGAIGAITIVGSSNAVGFGSVGYAIATFASNIVRVSSTTGIKISLGDVIFGTDSQGNYVMNAPGKGIVNASFTLATVPLPAALPLSLAALGLMGFVGRRRKSKTIA